MIAIGAIIDGDAVVMPQNKIVRAQGRIYLYSWTTGMTQAKLPELKSERDVLSHALWLARNGREDEADRLVENFCASPRAR